MSDSKSKATAQPELSTFYYPDARDGLGGSVSAATKEEADKLAKAGKFNNPSEATETAGEDKAE